MSETLIQVENVSKKFCRDLKRSLWYGMKDLGNELLGGLHQDSGKLRKDEFWAVKDVSFELKRGECLGLIGPNGAGKTSLLRMLNGLIKPDRGRIEMRGRIGALIALGAGFNPILTGRENIYVNAAVLGLSKKEIDAKFDEIVAFSGLEKFIDTPVQSYSSGMTVRLGFAVTTALEPDVLIIDEVLAVGDLGFKIKCLNAVNKMLKNTAVIFVSHTMQFVSRICSDIMVMENGQSVYYGYDVGKGIDSYYSAFQKPNNKVMGSGKADISNVSLSSGNQKVDGQDVLFLRYGDGLNLEMAVKMDCSAIKPAIKIFFLDQEFRPVAECYSKNCGFTFDGAMNESILKIRFRKLRFNAGIYFLSISVLDEFEKDEILCRLDYAASFQVHQEHRSWAPFLIEGEWDLRPG